MDELTLDYVNKEWAKDAVIEDLDITRPIRAVPVLHAKWLGHVSVAKDNLRKLEKQYFRMRKIKFRYYRGELSKDELVKLGWNQWQGNKPLKNEMDEFLKGDVDLVNIEDKIKGTETLIWTMEQILRSIHQRGYDLKTLLAAKQFYNGG